jgi:hypothetical protein
MLVLAESLERRSGKADDAADEPAASLGGSAESAVLDDQRFLAAVFFLAVFLTALALVDFFTELFLAAGMSFPLLKEWMIHYPNVLRAISQFLFVHGR